MCVRVCVRVCVGGGGVRARARVCACIRVCVGGGGGGGRREKTHRYSRHCEAIRAPLEMMRSTSVYTD